MIKTIHVHSDHKFLNLTFGFVDPEIQCDVLYFGNPNQTYNHQIKYFVGTSKSDLRKAISIINTYDMVVMYDLDLYKSYLVNRIDKKIVVFWRFFGLELYHQMLDEVLSEQSKRYNHNSVTRNFVRMCYNILSKGINKDAEFKSAIKRVDYFLGLCKQEYDYLIQRFDLPKFLNVPYTQVDYKRPAEKKNNHSILIGNNRSIYNNHLEVIDLLKDFPEYQKFLFLNYGTKGKYYLAVTEKVRSYSNYTSIDNFLSQQEFESFYKDLNVFVLNGYRQMAVGNIFTALKNSVKVYMNPINSYYSFLVDLGFPIFTIDKLSEDLQKGNILLTSDQISQIEKAYQQLAARYSKKHFVELIIQIGKDKINNRS